MKYFCRFLQGTVVVFAILAIWIVLVCTFGKCETPLPWWVGVIVMLGITCGTVDTLGHLKWESERD